MSDAFKVSFLMDLATNIFLKEKSFLQNIYINDENTNLVNIKSANNEQIWCLLMILLFIANKEIPLEKRAFDKISSSNLQYLKSLQDYKKFQDLIQSPREDIILNLIRFANAFPFLVKPVVKK